MKIEIPDIVFANAPINEKDFLVEIAILLYTKADYSWANAARFANLSRDDFKRELWKRKIPINYDIDDFNEDIANSKFLLNDSGE